MLKIKGRVHKTEAYEIAARSIHQDIEKGTLPIDAFCEMCARSLEANALFISLFQSEDDEINGVKVCEEFIMTAKGMLTGVPLLEHLTSKYTQRYQRRADILQAALGVLKGRA